MNSASPPQPATPAAAPAGRDQAAPQSRRLALLLAVVAGLCWAAAFALLLWGAVTPEQPLLAPARLVYYGLALLAALLTFIPVQQATRIAGVAFEGVAGSLLLLYTLAFVPPPQGWLLAPPDAPLYAIMAAALFWTVSAAATPLTFAAGQLLFRQRARRYDARRASRQAHEIGALAALTVGLAGLRVLTPLGVLLLALILVVAELMFLSFVETETP